MGSPTNEAVRDSVKTQHQVTLAKVMYLAKTEVTQAERQPVMGWNELSFPGAAS